jgi:hypothetical protein
VQKYNTNHNCTAIETNGIEKLGGMDTLRKIIPVFGATHFGFTQATSGNFSLSITAFSFTFCFILFHSFLRLPFSVGRLIMLILLSAVGAMDVSNV